MAMCILHCLHLEISLSAQLSTAQEIIRTSAQFHLFASHFSHGTNDERLLKLPSCVFLILPVQCTVRYLNFTLSHLNLSVPYPVFPTAMTLPHPPLLSASTSFPMCPPISSDHLLDPQIEPCQFSFHLYVSSAHLE